MFGQEKAVRIRAAEEALTQARLEEALAIISSPDVAETRRGRSLLERLGAAYLQRGQDRLLGRRFAEALADFDQAARCACKPQVVSEWRLRAQEAWRGEQKGASDKTAALSAAEAHMRRGQPDEASRALAGLPGEDAEVRALQTRISQARKMASEAMGAAQAAFAAGDFCEAIARLRAARRQDVEADGAATLETQIVEAVTREANQAFVDGRLDRAAQQLERLGEIGRGLLQRVDLEEALHLAREAAAAIDTNRYARAGVLLARLTQFQPKANWTKETHTHLAALDDHRRAVLAGPLGLLLGSHVGSQVSMSAAAATETVRRPAVLAGPAATPTRMRISPGERDNAGRMTNRMLLRIDGVGSFLLLRGERVSIGRAGPGATADLRLVSDLSERQAEIIRAGDDCFIASSGGVELAGHPVDYALLQDGDRIRLGRRVRLTFLRPSKKSSTAVLDLGDGVRTTTDCRRVILWSGPLIMGSTRECHVRLSPSVGGAILTEREGRLYFRPMTGSGEMLAVKPGTPAEWGELRFKLQPWDEE